jgi:hypothetical protein
MILHIDFGSVGVACQWAMTLSRAPKKFAVGFVSDMVILGKTAMTG